MDPYVQEWCDIEEEDTIPDKCIINVLLIQDLTSIEIIGTNSVMLPINSVQINSVPIIENSNTIENINDTLQQVNEKVRHNYSYSK